MSHASHVTLGSRFELATTLSASSEWRFRKSQALKRYIACVPVHRSEMRHVLLKPYLLMYLDSQVGSRLGLICAGGHKRVPGNDGNAAL